MIWAVLAVDVLLAAFLARRGHWGAWARTGLTAVLFVCLFS